VLSFHLLHNKQQGWNHATQSPPRADRPCFLLHTHTHTHTHKLNRYETSLFSNNKTPKENLNLYINRGLNGRTVNTELLWNIIQIWFPGLQLYSFFFMLHHVQMFQQPCWVFNNLPFRDCTYSVPFVQLPWKLYYTKGIIHIKKCFISPQLSFEIPAFCAPIYTGRFIMFSVMVGFKHQTLMQNSPRCYFRHR
jgi:hypothetical protein